MRHKTNEKISSLGEAHDHQRSRCCSHPGECASPLLTPGDQPNPENTDASAPDYPTSTYPWPPSLRQYVKQAYDAGNAVRGIENSELQQKMRTIITDKAVSGHLYLTDWDAHPLPQDIILQEREQAALYGAEIARLTNISEHTPDQYQQPNTMSSLPAQTNSEPNADLERQDLSSKSIKGIYSPSWSVFICHLLVALPGALGGPLIIQSYLSSGDPPPYHGHYDAVILCAYYIGWASYVGTHTISAIIEEPHARSLLSGLLVLFCTLFFTILLGPFDK